MVRRKLVSLLLTPIFIFSFTSPSFADNATNGEVTLNWKPVKKPKSGKCAYQKITVSSNVKIDSGSLAIGGFNALIRDVGLPDEISLFPSAIYYANEINPSFSKQEKMLICNYMTKATLPPYFIDFTYYYTVDDLINQRQVQVRKKFKFKK
jgi:hypothetical protein